jgi:hypothetical protein
MEVGFELRALHLQSMRSYGLSHTSSPVRLLFVYFLCPYKFNHSFEIFTASTMFTVQESFSSSVGHLQK